MVPAASMKRLALITDAWVPQVNGVVTTLEKMIEHAESHGWAVTVIHPGLFRTIPTPTYPEIKTAVNIWKIRKLIPRDIDSVHISTEGSLGIAARTLCWSRKWSYTSGFHTNFPDYIHDRFGIPTSYTYPLFRWVHDQSKAVMAPSRSTQEKLNRNGFKNVIVWGRGFNKNIFYPRPAIQPITGIPKLLYVGRVAFEKNLEELLVLSKKYPDITIVGDGPDRAKLEKKYPDVKFIGYRKGAALAECYRSADIFVFPSYTDTFGVVMLEAMACGLPVVAHDVEGPKDVILHKQGGILSYDLDYGIQAALRLKGNPSVMLNAALHTWEKSADTFFNNLVNTAGSRFMIAV
jgi:glycosyltransferase involved in cell wall biosynthesis